MSDTTIYTRTCDGYTYFTTSQKARHNKSGTPRACDARVLVVPAGGGAKSEYGFARSDGSKNEWFRSVDDAVRALVGCVDEGER